MSTLTDSRGEDYGHPRDHFSRTLSLARIVLGDQTTLGELRDEDWAVLMVCDKLARWSETKEHRDSIADVAGYAECYLMCVEDER